MSSYQIADGHDNAAGLTAVTPQPASEGLLYPERIHATDGTPIDKGSPFVAWLYGPELPEDEYASLLTQLGLANAIYNDVTIKTMTDAARTTWTNYNGRIIRPARPEYRKGFYRKVEFLIIMLEEI